MRIREEPFQAALASGLSAGDQVIVSGIQKIGDGSPVQIVPSAPAGGK